MHIYDIANVSVQTILLPIEASFPHNYQICQLGNDRSFILGGGDFARLPESMFMTRELVNVGGHYNLQKKKPMKFARHGHAACSFGKNFLIVTGSRKDHDGADQAVEIYDANNDTWKTLKPMTTGRHYHSSCSFNKKFVYVFCGISNQTRRYINTVERLKISDEGLISATEPW